MIVRQGLFRARISAIAIVYFAARIEAPLGDSGPTLRYD
jgi:hypothetical protein